MADLSTLRLPTGLASIFGGAAPTIAPVTDASSYAVADPTPTPPPAPPSAWDVLPHMAMGKSLPDAYAAAQRGPPAFDASALPAVPTAPVSTNRAGDIVDSLLFDGAFRKTRMANYAAQRQGYEDQLARFNAIRSGQAIDSIPDPIARGAAILNPGDYAKEAAKNVAPQTLSPGQKVVFNGPDGPQVGNDAVTLDAVSGKNQIYDPVTRTMTTGPSLGGGFLPPDSSGNVVSSRTGPTGQSLPTFHEVAPGARGDFVAPPGSGAGADVSTASGSVGAPAAGTRAARNKNPLNVKALPNGQMWLGQTGTDANGFAQFSDPAMAIRAAQRNLNTYGKRDGINTVAGAISRWAPQSDGNDTQNYIKGVAQALGVDPNAKIDLTNPQTQAAMVAAMQPFESGGTPTRVPSVGAPRGRGGLPSSLTGGRVTQNADGTQTDPTGKVSAGPSFYGPSEVAAARKDYYGSDEHREAVQATSAFNSLNDAIKRFGGNNGVLDTAAVANLARAETGLSARQGTMDTLMSHLGLPQELEGKASNLFGKGSITPQSLKQLHAMLGSYVTAKRTIAQERINNEESNAQSESGGTRKLGLALPSITPIPTTKWFDGTPLSAGTPGGTAAAPTYTRAQLEAEMRRRGLVK